MSDPAVHCLPGGGRHDLHPHSHPMIPDPDPRKQVRHSRPCPKRFWPVLRFVAGRPGLRDGDGMSRFANPCEVCGAADDHAEAMKATLEAVAADLPVATVCPHPREPGHGTGCTCAGQSRSLVIPLPEHLRGGWIEDLVTGNCVPFTRSDPLGRPR